MSVLPKKAFYPSRGLPQAWEIKSAQVIKPNPWKRSKNRRFCQEVERLVKAMGGTAYAATILKSNMMVGFDLNLSTARPEAEVGQTSKGRPYTNWITVF